MIVGQLDREIVIQTRSTSRDSRGGIVESWSTLATVWAYVRPMVARERFISGAIREDDIRVMTIRFRNDFDVEARVQYEGKNWRIVGIAERGRGRWTELTTEIIR